MVALVAAREVRERGRGKGYLISTAILLVVVFAGAVFVNAINDDDETRSIEVGVLDDGYSDVIVERDDTVASLGAGSPDLEVTVYDVSSPAIALEGDGSSPSVDVVFDGTALIWSQFPDREIDNYVRGQIARLVATNRAQAQGLSPADLAAVFARVEIDEQRLDTDDEDQSGMRMITSMVSGFGLFLLLQIWGGQIMLGVVEEKQSRVVEVLLSKIRPRELLAGKVAGIGVLGLIQAAILIGGLALALSLAGDLEVPDGVWSTIPLLGACFLLGFIFYGAAFAAVGSMASRIEDVQSAQLPAMLPLVISYMLIAFNLGTPASFAIKILSFVPFSSPLALPFRHAHNPMPPWQIGLALFFLTAGAAVMFSVAGAVYQRSILRVGRRVKIGDLFAAWRQDD